VADVRSPNPVRPRLALAGALVDDAPRPPGDDAAGPARASDAGIETAAGEVGELGRRVAELELRVREQDETEQMHETELLAMERDLALKEAYVKRLEREQDRLREEIGQVRERAAELFGDLERSEERIVELGALAADIQRQASYRMSVVIVRVLRRSGPLFALGRRGLRRLTGR